MRKLPAAMHNSTMEYTPGSSGWRLASENTFKSYRNGIAVSKDEVTQNPWAVLKRDCVNSSPFRDDILYKEIKIINTYLLPFSRIGECHLFRFFGGDRQRRFFFFGTTTVGIHLGLNLSKYVRRKTYGFELFARNLSAVLSSSWRLQVGSLSLKSDFNIASTTSETSISVSGIFTDRTRSDVSNR